MRLSEMPAGAAAFSLEPHVRLEGRLIGKLWLLRIGYLADHFLTINKEELT